MVPEGIGELKSEGITELYLSSKGIDELIPEGIPEMESSVKMIHNLSPKLINKFYPEQTLEFSIE